MKLVQMLEKLVLILQEQLYLVLVMLVIKHYLDLNVLYLMLLMTVDV
jgi:hypothetical protein